MLLSFLLAFDEVYLLFDEWPDLPTLTGTAIIIATGLYSLHRERFRALEAANRQPSP